MPSTTTMDVGVAMPRIYDQLWAERGADLQAARRAAIEAEAATAEAMGGPV